ncbi:hypothetical protein DDN79_01355 [Vibrio cholerae]|nr:hypothetical protein [Vibrio cholerae]EGQ9105018.1 hypothetical protein [Vibrio cholerae]EGQ9982597.1 hypothetical protein [Vibrio cholerae]EGR1305035.1 hypothetical protein [Vibrio cholerae]EGR4131011.1 hypothetical protein [Vibrio cholerae]
MGEKTMFSVEGICDWCKQPKLLTRHEYVDGKAHHSCENCNEFARMDVRQFNLAEMAFREKQQAVR